MRKTISVSILLAALIASTQSGATGLMTCDSGDRSTWQSQESLKVKMLKQGWQVRFMKIDGDCYEVYGTSPEGDRVEAYFHPVTLEKLLVSRRGETMFKK